MTNSPLFFLLGTHEARWMPRLGQWLAASDRAGGELAQQLADGWQDWPSDRKRDVERLAPNCREVLVKAHEGSNASAPFVLADLRWGQAASALAAALPQAQFLVCVEHPVEGLSRRLAVQPEIDPSFWLAEWRQAARRLLRLVQSQPQRTACFNAGEGVANPQALATWVGRQLHLPTVLPAPSIEEDESAPALQHVFAWAAWQVDLAGQALLDELDACCDVLGDVAAAPCLLADEHLQSAAVQLQRWPRREAELERALLQLQQQLHEKEQRWRELQEVHANDLHCAESRSKLDREQFELLTQRLLDTQEKLAAHFDRQDDWERRLELAGMERGQAALEMHRLRSDLVAAREELQQAMLRGSEQKQELELRLQTGQVEVDQLREELESMSRQEQRLGNELQAERTQRNELNQRLEAAREQLLQTLREAEGLQQQRNEQQVELAQLRQELEALSRQEQRLGNELQAERTHRNELNQRLEAAREQLLQTQREAEGLQQQGNDQQVELAQLRQEWLAVDQQRQQLLATWALARQEGRELTERLDRQQLAAERAAASHMEEVRKWEMERQRLEVELHSERAELAALRQREELTQSHLRQLQAELERLFLSQRSLLAEAGTLRQELSESDQQQQRLRGELTRQQHDAAALRQREVLMQGHVRQLQEELERLFLDHRSLQRRARQIVVPGGVSLSMADQAVKARRDTTVHRDIDLNLLDVQCAGQSLGDLKLRLVEHQGHPGVLLFAGQGTQQLLQQWRANGEEDGQPYMLLLPSDPASQPVLETLGASDWAILQAVLGRVQLQLQGSSDEGDRRWGRLAARLKAQMSELPLRLRWDKLEARPHSAEGSPPTLLLEWSHLVFGARELQRMQLSWILHGPRCGICLEFDPLAGAPLSSWPVDEQGEPVPQIWLPLGPASDAAQARRIWATLQPNDQDFLLGLLRAWPADLLERAREMTGAPVNWSTWQRSALRACGRLPTLRSGLGRLVRVIGRRLGSGRPQRPD